VEQFSSRKGGYVLPCYHLGTDQLPGKQGQGTDTFPTPPHSQVADFTSQELQPRRQPIAKFGFQKPQPAPARPTLNWDTKPGGITSFRLPFVQTNMLGPRTPLGTAEQLGQNLDQDTPPPSAGEAVHRLM
jgi:hypothetical protein